MVALGSRKNSVVLGCGRVRHDMAELLRSEGDPDAAEPLYEELLSGIANKVIV
jgi:hypothetical protein